MLNPNPKFRKAKSAHKDKIGLKMSPVVAASLSIPSGAAGALTAPARARVPRCHSLTMEERAGERAARRRMDARVGGLRTTRRRRCRMAAATQQLRMAEGLVVGNTPSPSRMKYDAGSHV
jgi:hypothetical protein